MDGSDLWRGRWTCQNIGGNDDLATLLARL